MAYDVVSAVLACYASSALILRGTEFTPSLGAAAVFAFSALLAGNVLGLYERRTLQSRIKFLLKIMLSISMAVLCLALFVNLVLYEQIGRWVLMGTGLASGSLALLPRLLGHHALHLYRIRILAIADSEAAMEIARCLEIEEECYQFVGYCGDRPDASDPASAPLSEVLRVCRERGVDQIVVTRKYVGNPMVLQICFDAARMGCEVQDETAFHEDFLEQVQTQGVDKGVFFSARVGGATPVAVFLKRLMDITLAFTGGVLSLPLWVVIWFVLRFAVRTDPIYTQERCGQFGKPFLIYKFRTMRPDAEDDGAQWARTDDPRVTAFGNILRKTRLDEIPQFWNILKGDMSFVGPRPERPELVRRIEQSVPYFSFRHWARPGLTGLAQIRFRYSASMEDAKQKLRYDLYYIKHWSLFLDIQILLRTISQIMKGAV